MANPNDKQKVRPEASRKPATLEIHVSTKAAIVLAVMLLLPHFALVVLALTHKSIGPDAAVKRLIELLEPKGGNASEKNQALLNVADRASSCTPGPWGNLEYVRMSIEIPEEYVSAHLHETVSPTWLFKNYTPERLTEFLGKVNLSAAERKELLDRNQWRISPTGVILQPTSQTLLSLGASARSTIYSALAEFPENNAQDQPYAFPPGSFERHFTQSGLTEQTVSLVRRLCYPHGELLLFADLPTVLQTLQTYEEKVHLEKALSRRETLLVKLHVTPDSNIDDLLKYWGRAGSGKDLRPLLESLSRVPGGARVSLAHLIPPWPTARLYSFPFPSQTAAEDCHWTSFNFFRDPPEPIPQDGQFLRHKLDTEYYPVTSDPRYGDLVMVATAAGPIIHSCVYLADNIVYSKNGANHTAPWLLATIPEVLSTYAAYIPTNETLKVLYYRNRNY